MILLPTSVSFKNISGGIFFQGNFLVKVNAVASLTHLFFYFQDCALRISSPQKTLKLSRTCQNGILSTYPVETVSCYLALTFFIILYETMLYHTHDMSSWTRQRKKYWKRSVKIILRVYSFSSIEKKKRQKNV